MSLVAIIPARGGSKRLPRKNILPVLNKPMLSYPVKTALESRLFDQVIVSTEDREIRQAALKSGAAVYDRPESLCDDKANVVMVCLDLLEKLKNEGIEPTHFCCIYATAIFITIQDLHASYEIMTNNTGTDVVMGVSEFNLQPVQALESNKKGWLKHKWPEFNGVQSQFHPVLTASNGTLYWANTQTFAKNKTFYPEKLKGYEIPWIRAIDIDTMNDYKNVQLLAPSLLTSSLHKSTL